MTAKRLCSFTVVLRTRTTFSNIQAMEDKRWAEKHQGHNKLKKKKRKDGEMDDETCMKGLWDFIIHVTHNQRIPEADSFFPSSWLIVLNIQVVPSDLSITSVEFKIRAGRIKINVTWYLKHQTVFIHWQREFLRNNMNVKKKKKVTKFNKTHFVDYLNCKWIDPSTLVDRGGDEEISVGSV